MIENVDRRVLAGFRFLDAITGASIVQTLSVDAAPLVLSRNNSGIFAVMDAPGLTGLTNQFIPADPASWPAPSSYELTVQDPSSQYLARRAQIAVPQPLAVFVSSGTTASPPTTTLADAPPSIRPVTTPQDIVLYPAPVAPVAPNWAVVRTSVASNATPPVPLARVVVQVTISGSKPITGLTNRLGETLIAAPGLGLQLSSSGTGAVTETTTPATVTAFFDPTPWPQDFIPNPDDILLDLTNSKWKTASTSVQLAPGQTVFVNLTISM
jgi:hypothetical protein